MNHEMLSAITMLEKLFLDNFYKAASTSFKSLLKPSVWNFYQVNFYQINYFKIVLSLEGFVTIS